jgi:hypothetical protein
MAVRAVEVELPWQAVQEEALSKLGYSKEARGEQLRAPVV